MTFNSDRAVAEWVAARIPETDFGEWDFTAIGLSENGIPIAGVVYNNCRVGPDGPVSVEMHIAADSPRWAHRRTLQIFFGFPFSRLLVNRVTAITTEHNSQCRSMLERLGFVHEGSMRKAYPSGETAEIYGMLREECRWIDGRQFQKGHEERQHGGGAGA
jgi:RimJ/RimL family protein N-acetyltransferase